MIVAMLWLGLLSAPETVSPPDDNIWKEVQPYIGAGLAPFPYYDPPVTHGGVRYRHHQKFCELGAAYKFRTTVVDEVPWIDWFITPELIFNPDMFALDVAVGPEVKFSFGRYAMPSDLFLGLQFGGYFSVPMQSVIPDNSYALIVGAYVGPQFDMYSVSMKVQVNSKFLLGNIAARSVRTAFANDVGYLLGVNFQFQLL